MFDQLLLNWSVKLIQILLFSISSICIWAHFKLVLMFTELFWSRLYSTVIQIKKLIIKRLDYEAIIWRNVKLMQLKYSRLNYYIYYIKMKNGLWRWIEMVDCYSTPVSFTHKNKFKIKTWFGGALTIATVILTVIYFCLLIVKPIKLISMDSSLASGLFGSGNTQGVSTGGTWNTTVKSYKIEKSNKRMSSLSQVDVHPYWSVAITISGGYDPTYVKLNFTQLQWYILLCFFKIFLLKFNN